MCPKKRVLSDFRAAAVEKQPQKGTATKYMMVKQLASEAQQGGGGGNVRKKKGYH